MPNELWWDISAQQLTALLRLMPDFDRALTGEAAYHAFANYPVGSFEQRSIATHKQFVAMDWPTFAAVLAHVKQPELL